MLSLLLQSCVNPPITPIRRGTVHLPLSLLLEAGFRKCQLDVESHGLLRAILQVLASLENPCLMKGLLQPLQQMI